MTSFDILIEESNRFKNDVENIKIGAKSHTKLASIEENIIRIKEVNKFLHSKLQALNAVSSIQSDENRLPSEDNIIAVENNLADKIVDEKLRGKLLRAIYMEQRLQELLEADLSEEPEKEAFKKKIEHQFQHQSILNQALKNVLSTQQNVLQETIELKIDLKEAQTVYKKKLLERKQKSLEEKDKKLGADYKEKFQSIEKRIAKLNFMRVLTSRLLLYGVNDWENRKEFAGLIQKMRLPYTLESFKN